MKFVYILSAALLLFVTSATKAQQKIYIKITSTDIIEGESIVKSHEKQIEANSFAQESTSCEQVGTQNNCKAKTSTFVLDMVLNKAIIGLRKALYKGTNLQKVEVFFTKTSSNGPVDYYKITLEDVVVTGITDANSGELNQNEVQFSATRFGWSYAVQNANGSLGTPIKWGWDQSTNSEWTGF